jgi:hypothetical protein
MGEGRPLALEDTMATLVLQTVGGAVGTAAGGPIGGAVGRVLGSLAGGAIDNALLGSDSPRTVEGPRPKDMDGLTSTEGAPIPRVYGRARIGGQLIWATRFEEVVTVARERSAAQGGKGSSRGARTTARRTRTSPIWRSGFAKARSLSCGESGRTGASSISPRSRCGFTAAASTKSPTP